MNRLALLLATTLLASAALAGHTLIPANQGALVAKSA